MTFLAVLALLVVAAVVGAGLIVVRQRRSYARSNEVVPGMATDAPAEWAGAHTPEAKLHRRLTAAVAALRANAMLSDAAFIESRVSVERTALSIDARLIAAAALAPGQRRAAVAAVEPAVVAVEDAVAALTQAPADNSAEQALDDSVRAAQMRLDALAEARAELDRFDPTPRPTTPPTEGGARAPR